MQNDIINLNNKEIKWKRKNKNVREIKNAWKEK